jgi:hypothetical protein
MRPVVTETPIPANSAIARHAEGANFADSYQVRLLNPSQSALEIYLSAVSHTPAWVEVLMTTRNRVVSLLGLKNLGSMGAVDASKPVSAYRVGDRVGIFTLHSLSEQEVVFADSDKHLNAKISVCKTVSHGSPSVAVTTVVHIHNALGRLYMALVVPVHRRIVPAMLRRLVL